MRSAQYICTLPAEQLSRVKELVGADRTERDVEDGYIGAVFNDSRPETASQVLKIIAPGVRRAELFGPFLYQAWQVVPHVDETTYRWTVGVVLEGDHYLFTGRGRKVCDLTPGVVYFLDNKRLHGAMRRDRQSKSRLVFVALDFYADSLADALKQVQMV